MQPVGTADVDLAPDLDDDSAIGALDLVDEGSGHGIPDFPVKLSRGCANRTTDLPIRLTDRPISTNG